MCVQFGLRTAYPRVLLIGNGCGMVRVCVCVCAGGRPRGGTAAATAAAAGGGALVAFVSSFLPLGFQIDVCFLGRAWWRAKGSPLKRSDTYYCLLNSMQQSLRAGSSPPLHAGPVWPRETLVGSSL